MLIINIQGGKSILQRGPDLDLRTGPAFDFFSRIVNNNFPLPAANRLERIQTGKPEKDARP